MKPAELANLVEKVGIPLLTAAGEKNESATLSVNAQSPAVSRLHRTNLNTSLY